jgi:RHS repeat-associated protein
VETDPQPELREYPDMPETPSSTAQGDSASSDAASPFSAPQINLPKGGGAIRGIGEKFAANAATGTGSFSVPIALSAGRSGFGPQISLSYDSGSSNGPVGMGCAFSLPSITRKTDKGLPRFQDREKEESDVFILSGAEDLVPVLLRDRDGEWVYDEFERGGFGVKRYRPRIEGLFARIERWTRLADGDAHWRSITKDNILTVYGRDANSRISDPRDPTRVFSWLTCESYDDKGNAIVYEYAAENHAGVDLAKPNERDRQCTANRYLKRIRYGNRRPLLLNTNSRSFRDSHVDLIDLETASWMFEAVFDYGEGYYSEEPPDNDGWVHVRATPDAQFAWPVRKDPFSSYRSTFEVRTYRLCRRVLMFHHFPEQLGADDYLVRSTEFEYREKPVGSFMTRIVQSGYTLQPDGRYRKSSLPAIDLEYTASPLENDPAPHYEVKEVDPENLPAGIDGENYKWLDLYGEGIAGVLVEQGDSWFYKPNAGKGHFRPLKLVAHKPSGAAEGKQQLLDLEGDGALDLVSLDPPAPGFYERTVDEGWGSFRAFHSFPVRDWHDPNLRFVDITGDGIADVLITEDDAFIWHPSFLDEGFGEAVRVPVPHDEREGPHVVFADGTQSVYLADMSGDGLSDLVRIRNGEICYWPNLGYGRFGKKITMDNSPWFADADLFDQGRVKLADTDGSGTTDIVYLGGDGIKIFLNFCGNGWSDPRVLRQFSAATDLDSVSVVDFLGRGTACLLWSSTLPSDSMRVLRYIDLMKGVKPHLLIGIRNNLGAETRIEYASSTEFYLADKAAGTPWITRLPFPVQVVKRVETYDYISRNRFVCGYTYHHGFFDPLEREFRGFGRVDQVDTEEFAALSQNAAFPNETNFDQASNVPPVLTKTWFHTGVYLSSGRISRHLDHEYFREPGLTPEEQDALLLDDTILPEDRMPEEAREACRALKGSTLRQEVYALDATEESPRPYTVAESNFTIHTLQIRDRNRHAVFFTHARESISFNYERKLYEIDGRRRADPRVTHSVTLKTDDYGNVLQVVNIGYGRRFPDRSSLLNNSDRAAQQQILLTLSTNRFTNAVLDPDAFRTPLIAESSVYELIHIAPRARDFGTTNRIRFDELAEDVARASDGHHDLPYQDIESKGAVTAHPYRRLLKRDRTLYRADNLDRLLRFGELQPLALPGHKYRLAFTQGLLEEIYRRETPNHSSENLLPHSEQILRDEGRYLNLDNADHWWIPSGSVSYSPHSNDDAAAELLHAKQHFFLPDRFRDPFGNVSTIRYDAHDLAPVESRDALDNTVRAEIDYRTLSPNRMTDANGNRTQVAFDTLGMVVGTAVMGKKGEHQGDTLEGFVADLPEHEVLEHMRRPLHDPWQILQKATTRLVYDLFAYARSRHESQPQPLAVYTMARETHVSDLHPGEKTKIQHAFSYSDGFSREIQKKLQAAPVPLQNGGPVADPRWIGSGWTIFNNKGKPVRQYEPFFTASHAFEFAVKVGVSPILIYDAPLRVIATLHANHTFEKVVFDPWQQQTWDANDTVLIANPDNDADVGGFIAKLPQTDYLPTWYAQRESGALGKAEQTAAAKASIHANTPAITCFDSLGRSFLAIAHNRFLRDESIVDKYFSTRTQFDIEGNQLSITDALNRTIMSYAYDMSNTKIRQKSADAGERWLLNDATGKPLRSWDSREHEFHYRYDSLRRQVELLLKREHSHASLAERIVYGEGLPDAIAHNLRMKAFQQYDGAGVITNEQYDFKGNLLTSSRHLLEEYREVEVDWSRTPKLENESYTVGKTYDALNRLLTSALPDKTTIHPHYNPTNLLDRVRVNLRGSATATEFVGDISYNPKGQREFIAYGNGAHTHYSYDPLTFRLMNLKTTRIHDHARLQDLAYTYDPVGNITFIHDGARETIYFNNQVVSPSSSYVYDAVYRLIDSDGREHIGQLSVPETTYDDSPRMDQPLPGDGQAMRKYRERYAYDAVGNILQVIHSAAGGSWTRRYRYDEPRLHPANNRLSATSVGELREHYTHDANGNMTRMPHLHAMEWDFKNQLHATQQQVVHDDEARKTYYVYDASGQRVRKVTARGAGSKAHERIYLGGFEIYREYSQDGAIKLERDSVHVMDDKRRVALVETKTIDAETARAKLPSTLIRYQFSNQIESSTLEVDETAAIISFEEYYPYGSTSYESVRKQVEASPKRYRYAGKERDNETGFYYVGARYYASWLGRWTSCDPGGLRDGPNLFVYVSDNPVKNLDPNGKWKVSWTDIAIGAGIAALSVAAVVVTAGAAAPAIASGLAYAGVGAETITALGTAAVATGTAVGAADVAKTGYDLATDVNPDTGKPFTDEEASRKLGGMVVGAAATFLGGKSLFGGGGGGGIKVELPESASLPGVTENGIRVQFPSGASAPPATITIPTTGLVGVGALGIPIAMAMMGGGPGGGGGGGGEGSKSGGGEEKSGGGEEKPRVFENQQPETLEAELADAEALGVRPVEPTDPDFAKVVNQGRVKWAVTEDGKLVVVPHTVEGTEISHAVLTQGKPVIAAGEADISSTGANTSNSSMGIDITPDSGHYMYGNDDATNAKVLEIGRAAFAVFGINFPK